MATYRDPAHMFAPLEVVERLLEIRTEAGYAPNLFVRSSGDIATYLDAYGFDAYAFDDVQTTFQFGKYRAVCAPGGDHAHSSISAH